VPAPPAGSTAETWRWHHALRYIARYGQPEDTPLRLGVLDHLHHLVDTARAALAGEPLPIWIVPPQAGGLTDEALHHELVRLCAICQRITGLAALGPLSTVQAVYFQRILEEATSGLQPPAPPGVSAVRPPPQPTPVSVDYSRLRLGSRPHGGGPIVVCPVCGKKGISVAAWTNAAGVLVHPALIEHAGHDSRIGTHQRDVVCLLPDHESERDEEERMSLPTERTTAGGAAPDQPPSIPNDSPPPFVAQTSVAQRLLLRRLHEEALQAILTSKERGGDRIAAVRRASHNYSDAFMDSAMDLLDDADALPAALQARQEAVQEHLRDAEYFEQALEQQRRINDEQAEDLNRVWSEGVQRALHEWLDIRGREQQEVPTTWRQLQADVAHSALLARLLAGKAPLPQAPPRSYSYPWYSLIENGGEGDCEVYMNGAAAETVHGAVVTINQSHWELVACSANVWIVRHPGAPGAWRLWQNEPEQGAHGWRLERLNDSEPRPALLGPGAPHG
jgi:hypothetical protein